MQFLNRNETIRKVNEFARRGEPFFFMVDFLLTRGLVMTPSEATEAGIFYHVRAKTNAIPTATPPADFSFETEPVSFTLYEKAFNRVMDHLRRGDTYLLNLTFPTKLQTDLTPEAIFTRSEAPFRLLFRDEFVVFSPEIFVHIRDGAIWSYPMKGTIDASVPDAENKILQDRKEFYEHNTIVDLIRNDLSMVSAGVTVERFRYIDRIRTNRAELLQVSSAIRGNLPDGYRENLGELLFRLLPAGSVTGAPKEKTVQIIRETETYDRGFYTGIFGYSDGESLDSAVMIRFIEKTPGGLVYKSGGGITALSDARSEYEELIQKVYVPVV
jgi:para-aminobenzoate synthetase component 1